MLHIDMKQGLCNNSAIF